LSQLDYFIATLLGWGKLISDFSHLDLSQLLMTKFGKSEKTRLSSLLFWNIRFLQFQSKAKEEAKFEDLKIQDILKQEKGLKDIEGPRKKKFKQKAKVIKTGPSGLPNQSIRFSQNK
jgi:hypothetical protein